MELSTNEIKAVVNEIGNELRHPAPHGYFWDASAYTSNKKLLQQLYSAREKVSRAIELTEYLEAHLPEPA